MLILSIITTLVGLVTFLSLVALECLPRKLTLTRVERLSTAYMFLVSLLLLWYGINGLVEVWG